VYRDAELTPTDIDLATRCLDHKVEHVRIVLYNSTSALLNDVKLRTLPLELARAVIRSRPRHVQFCSDSHVTFSNATAAIRCILETVRGNPDAQRSLDSIFCTGDDYVEIQPGFTVENHDSFVQTMHASILSGTQIVYMRVPKVPYSTGSACATQDEVDARVQLLERDIMRNIPPFVDYIRYKAYITMEPAGRLFLYATSTAFNNWMQYTKPRKMFTVLMCTLLSKKDEAGVLARTMRGRTVTRQMTKRARELRPYELSPAKEVMYALRRFAIAPPPSEILYMSTSWSDPTVN
jgi:hypothetical protein